MTETDRDETPDETIHNLRIICGYKQEKIERLQQSIDDLYNFVGRDFAHLEPKAALEAHMAAVVKDAVAKIEQRGCIPVPKATVTSGNCLSAPSPEDKP